MASKKETTQDDDRYQNLTELLNKRGYKTAYEFGRSNYKYTDCGPWTDFTVPGEPEGRVYYGDARATQVDWFDRCTGIRLGSIVEGSDVEVGPVVLQFPFLAQDLDAALEGINQEASFYWERDNATYFTVLDLRGNPLLSAQWVEFADAPTGDFQADDLALAKKAGEALFAAASQSRDGLVLIPGTAYVVREDESPDITY